MTPLLASHSQYLMKMTLKLGYEENSEANYFADQAGIYVITTSNHSGVGKVMKQIVKEHVISWCGDPNQTMSIMGNNSWRDISTSVQIVLPSDQGNAVGAFIAVRVIGSGRMDCYTAAAADKITGVFFWISTSGLWSITKDLEGMKIIGNGTVKIEPDTVHTISIDVKGSLIVAAMIDGQTMVSNMDVSNSGKGHIAIGTSGYFPVEFNDFKLH